MKKEVRVREEEKERSKEKERERGVAWEYISQRLRWHELYSRHQPPTPARLNFFTPILPTFILDLWRNVRVFAFVVVSGKCKDRLDGSSTLELANDHSLGQNFKYCAFPRQFFRAEGQNNIGDLLSCRLQNKIVKSRHALKWNGT